MLGLLFHKIKFNKHHLFLFFILALRLSGIAQQPIITKNKNNATSGDCLAKIQLANKYWHALGVKKDTQKAQELYDYVEKNSSTINALALYYLALHYKDIDREKYKKILQRTDNFCQNCDLNNDANAIYVVSLMLKSGESGFMKSEEEWFKWAKKAALLNHLHAMCDVGRERFNSKSVIFKDDSKTQNFYKEGLKWVEKAAEGGSVSAMSCLGDIYYNERGVEKDQEKSLFWHKKAAEYGSDHSMMSLACHYDNLGDSSEANFREAAKYFRMAIDVGARYGMYKLGEYYYLGKGVNKNYVIAYALIDLADIVEGNGRVTTSDFLAFLYKNTIDFPKDKIKTYLSGREYNSAKKLSQKWNESGTAGEVFGIEDQFKKIIGIPYKRTPTGLGSGFFITTDGYILTAAHVIEDATKIDILVNSKVLAVKVIRVDSKNDVALLKSDGVFNALPVSQGLSIHLGADIFTIGFPNMMQQGASPKLTKGSISSKNGLQDDPSCYQVSVAIQPGNSGGPLLDYQGNVVGLIQAKLNDVNTLIETGAIPQNVNYALKSTYIMPLLDIIPKESRLQKPDRAQSFEESVVLAEKAVCIIFAYK